MALSLRPSAVAGKQSSTLTKWLIVIIYSILETFILLLATSYPGTQIVFQRQFHISEQTFLLGQTLNIVGNLVGAVILGPLSDIIGRKWIYVVATATFALWNLVLAYPPNFALIVVFNFLAGVSGAPALVNVGATLSDLFGISVFLALPTGIWVLGSTLGPILGSFVATWVLNAGLGTKWIFLVNVIIGFALSVILVFLPETNPRAAQPVSARSEPAVAVVAGMLTSNDATSDQSMANAGATMAPKKYSDHSSFDDDGLVSPEPLQSLKRESGASYVFTIVLRILLTEPMVLLLGIYVGVTNGILLLFIPGTIIDYIRFKHLTPTHAQDASLAGLVGVTLVVLFIPLQMTLYNRWRRTHQNRYQPEQRFALILPLAFLMPIAMLWAAFTSGPQYSAWSQIIANVVVAFVASALYLAQINYITDTYTDIAGAALAAWLVPAFVIQAVLAQTTSLYYVHLELKWGLAITGFISLGFVLPGVFVIYFLGPKIRGFGKLGRQF